MPADDSLSTTRLPWPSEEILDFAPIEHAPGTWVFVLRDGAVCRVDAEVCTIELPPGEPDHEPWMDHALTQRLHVSADGGFAAITNDFGRWGRVYDLATGRATLALDGGEYHPETVPLSFAFAEHRGRTVAIHRTDWNRLDVSDAATGELRTAREPTSYRAGEPRPPHYLDFFHGRLCISPDGRWILDDGWVWHPVGIPALWDLRRWLDDNVWESEDGATRTNLADRAYYWNHGMCWLDANRVAIAGLGDDDERMTAGARVFDTRGDELTTFAGPAGCFFGDGDRLFASTGDGLTVWDVDAGALVARIDGFTPTRQHRSGRELVERSGATLRRWRY